MIIKNKIDSPKIYFTKLKSKKKIWKRKEKMRIKMALCVASILVTQNLLLANETTKLDDVQVVTSASGYEQKITDAPASISVISQEDLKQKKYSNLAEAIEDVEGVDVRDGVGKTGGLNISIRGMGSANTLILIDGRRQNC